MAHLLRMPEVSANAAEAVLGEWSLAELEPFVTDDSLAVIETDKAAVEIEAEADGVVLKLLVTPGASVEVGAPIAVLGEPGEVVADMAAMLAELGVEERTPSRPAERRDVPEPPAEGRSAAGAGSGPQAASGVATDATPEHGRIFSSPLARRLARDADLQLADLTGRGSGPGGRVVRRDVEAAIESVARRAHRRRSRRRTARRAGRRRRTTSRSRTRGSAERWQSGSRRARTRSRISTSRRSARSTG
jgi:pyruvate dehydrogenase E2 component (dihydrolipoamide acetyltransferase)